MALKVVRRALSAQSWASAWHFVRTNKMLVTGLGIVFVLAVSGHVASIFVDAERADVGAGAPARPPSWLPAAKNHPGFALGTDQQGRDVFADLLLGTPATIRIGLIAGLLGVLAGTLLGFTGGYFGGLWDTFVTLATDVFMTIPALMILIVIVSMVQVLSTEALGLIIASLAWPAPARMIRSQVLTMRERAYVQIARLNGVRDFKIIVMEMVPNLLPFLAAGLVGATAAAVLASIGLSALGLGPQNEPSLGLTIYWSLFYGALIRGMWWWWGPPMLIIVLLFIGLFLAAAGLDQIANPRLRKSA